MCNKAAALRLLALAVTAAIVFTACGGGDDKPVPPTPTPGGQVTQLSVNLRSFAFEPDAFRFKAGDVVAFQFESKDIDHTFTVKELGIDWFVRTGGEAQEQFTFDQPGEYQLICVIAGHEQAGMVGVIVVE
jgi:plastocyanin